MKGKSIPAVYNDNTGTFSAKVELDNPNTKEFKNVDQGLLKYNVECIVKEDNGDTVSYETPT